MTLPPDPSSSATILTDAEARAVVAMVRRRFAGTPAGTLSQARLQGEPGTDEVQLGGALPYRWFKTRHPEYDAPYWRQLEALYAGGKALLGDAALMQAIFPPHRQEATQVYEERKRRAHYMPYAGEIIDHIVAALCAQQVEVNAGEPAEDGTLPELPPFYAELVKDCSPPGGRPCTLQSLVKQQVLTALKKRRAWTLVELPSVMTPDGEPAAFADYGEQEGSGALDAYFCALDPECVVDWEEDEDGGLYWAMTMVELCRREGLWAQRDRVTKRFTHYTPTGWRVFEITHRKGEEPEDLDPVVLVEEGEHSFGRVPLSKLELPHGLWAMEKLESLARAHFNQSSALGWAMTQSLFQELYEFHTSDGAPGVPPELADDSSRAVNQRRGQGHVQVRPAGDDARFIGPDTGPFAFALEAVNGIRDEMHRVVHQMALSTDNSAAALGRSGESKAQDNASTAVVLTGLGQLAREAVEDWFRLASLGRGEQELADQWKAGGMEKFDEAQVGETVEQAVLVEQLAIPSPTFKKRHAMQIVKMVLPELPPEDVDEIEVELEMNITDEMFDPQMAVDAKKAEAGLLPPPDGGDPEDDEEEDDEDEAPTQPGKQPAVPRNGKPMTKSRAPRR